MPGIGLTFTGEFFTPPWDLQGVSGVPDVQVTGDVYIDQSRPGRILYGVNSSGSDFNYGHFKVNISLAVGMRRRGGNIIHMTRAKTILQRIFANFTAIVHGINLPASGFAYVSDDQLLTITNVSGVTGMYPSNATGDGRFAIPMYPAVDQQIGLSDFHLPKLPS